MKNSIFQRYAPTLWIVAGVLFLLPGIFGSSKSHPSIGVGMMFIILGIVLFRKNKSGTEDSSNL